MEGGNLEVLRHTDISALIATLKDAILGVDHDAPPNTHIYLHCSAGIHRTGFFAYILLRLMGFDAAAALNELAELRGVTANQVGDDRIKLAEGTVATLIKPTR